MIDLYEHPRLLRLPTETQREALEWLLEEVVRYLDHLAVSSNANAAGHRSGQETAGLVLGIFGPLGSGKTSLMKTFLEALCDPGSLNDAQLGERAGKVWERLRDELEVVPLIELAESRAKDDAASEGSADKPHPVILAVRRVKRENGSDTKPPETARNAANRRVTALDLSQTRYGSSVLMQLVAEFEYVVNVLQRGSRETDVSRPRDAEASSANARSENLNSIQKDLIEIGAGLAVQGPEEPRKTYLQFQHLVADDLESLKEELAYTMGKSQQFGQSLAGELGSVIERLRELPIGDSLPLFEFLLLPVDGLDQGSHDMLNLVEVFRNVFPAVSRLMTVVAGERSHATRVVEAELLRIVNGGTVHDEPRLAASLAQVAESQISAAFMAAWTLDESDPGRNVGDLLFSLLFQPLCDLLNAKVHPDELDLRLATAIALALALPSEADGIKQAFSPPGSPGSVRRVDRQTLGKRLSLLVQPPPGSLATPVSELMIANLPATARDLARWLREFRSLVQRTPAILGTSDPREAVLAAQRLFLRSLLELRAPGTRIKERKAAPAFDIVLWCRDSELCLLPKDSVGFRTLVERGGNRRGEEREDELASRAFRMLWDWSAPVMAPWHGVFAITPPLVQEEDAGSGNPA